jgi:hypothetical protein
MKRTPKRFTKLRQRDTKRLRKSINTSYDMSFLELYQNAFARIEQWRSEAAGAHDFVCPTCFCSDVIALEGHHIAGRHFDPHIEYFCARCHRHLTVAQNAHPRPSCDHPGPIEQARHYDLGLALVLVPMATVFSRLGAELVELTESGEVMSDAVRVLTRKTGRYLLQRSPLLERVAQRLHHRGYTLLNDVQKDACQTPKRR